MGRKKGPSGHQRNAGEDPKGLEGMPLAVAVITSVAKDVSVGAVLNDVQAILASHPIIGYNVTVPNLP